MKLIIASRIIIALIIGLMLSACAGTSSKLIDTSWRLTDLNGQKLPSEIKITLNIKKDQAGGNSACNSYGSDFTQKGEKLLFSQLFSTMMYCDKGMEFETDYFAALGKIKSFQLENDQLNLLDGTGNVVLIFIKS
jgi:heat shock protein HslJ